MGSRDGIQRAQDAAAARRWRRAAAPAAAALFMLLVLAGSSVVGMAQREAVRLEQRTALLALEPSPTDLVLVERDDKWRGEQFPVVWVEPAGGAEPVLPPGVGRTPRPGQAVVSPALDRLASRHADLAARYPDRLVLGTEGVASGDELLAYVRMPAESSLQGDTGTVRVRAFGPPTGDEGIYVIYPTSEPLSVGAAIKGVLGFFIAPGLYVLAAGIAAPAYPRGVRIGVLSWAVFGLVGVTVLWALISRLLAEVPLTGHGVVRGDLALPWWLLLVELAACAVLTGLILLVATASSGRRTAPGRRGDPPPLLPRPFPATSTGVAAAAFWSVALSLAAFSYGGRFGGSLEAASVPTAMVAAVAGALLLLLVVLREFGARLGRLESLPARVAGREIYRDPAGAARPFLGFGAILVVALAAGGYRAIDHVEDPVLETGGPRAVFVEWLDPRADDPELIASATGSGLVVPFGAGGHSDEHRHHREQGHGRDHGQGHADGGATVLGSTCARLVSYFPGTACSPDAPYELPRSTEQRLAGVMAMASHDPDAGVRLAPADDVAASGSALVLDAAPLGVLEGRVRDAAMRTLPAPHVYSSLSNATRGSPTTAWIADGFNVAIVVLAVGCLISLGGHLVNARNAGEHRHRPVLSPGVRHARPSSLEAWRFAVRYGFVVAWSILVGLTACAVIVRPLVSGIGMPWPWIGAMLGIAGAVGVCGTVLAAFFGAGGAREGHEREDL